MKPGLWLQGPVQMGKTVQLPDRKDGSVIWGGSRGQEAGL